MSAYRFALQFVCKARFCDSDKRAGRESQWRTKDIFGKRLKTGDREANGPARELGLDAWSGIHRDQQEECGALAQGMFDPTVSGFDGSCAQAQSKKRRELTFGSFSGFLNQGVCVCDDGCTEGFFDATFFHGFAQAFAVGADVSAASGELVQIIDVDALSAWIEDKAQHLFGGEAFPRCYASA